MERKDKNHIQRDEELKDVNSYIEKRTLHLKEIKQKQVHILLQYKETAGHQMQTQYLKGY